MCEKDYTSALHTQQLAKSTMHKPFTTSELRWLWAQNTDIYKLILIQVYTGTRKNELSRIRMENVHLAEQYMAGAVIPSSQRGWTLLTVGGYSLGWGKGDGAVLKNHYPKGLRR